MVRPPHRNELQKPPFDPACARIHLYAAAEARSEVQALADALRVKLVRILSVREGQPIARPMRAMAMIQAAAAAPTPIKPGTIEVRASVTLTVEIRQN